LDSADTLVFGSSSDVSDSFFAMGGGTDSLVFGADVSNTFIDLGLGNDTIVFGQNSSMFNEDTSTVVDLSKGGADHIYLATDFEWLENFVITGASDDDVLWVGSSTLTRYGYATSDGWTERHFETGLEKGTGNTLNLG
jgi:hypothetical protein